MPSRPGVCDKWKAAHEGKSNRIPLLGQHPYAADNDRQFRRGVHRRGCGAFDDVEDIGSGDQNAGAAGFEKCPSSGFFEKA